MKIHAGHIEVEVAKLLNFRKYLIVPNVSWGWLNYEADMIAVDCKTRYCTEIEIKISLSDLKADFKKRHNHDNKKVSRLIYAMPESLLEKGLPLIPNSCGVISVKYVELPDSKYGKSNGGYWKAEHVRIAKRRKGVLPVSEKDVNDLGRLGCMRIWTLKQHNNNRKK